MVWHVVKEYAARLFSVAWMSVSNRSYTSGRTGAGAFSGKASMAGMLLDSVPGGIVNPS